MGRKVNPIGFRLPVRRDWKSRWYAKGRNFSKLVIKDAAARRMIEQEYATAMIGKIEIEQKIGSIRLIIHAARPGVIIGKKGEGIERLRVKMRKIFDINELHIDMKEIDQPESNAKVIALNIANQLENRVMFRRAMRRAMSNAMRLKDVEGIKIMSAGRLNGIEIARTEWYHEGSVPLHTLKNDIDYGLAEARTAMGVIGVKVWISKGDVNTVRKKAKYSYEAQPEGGGEQAIAEQTAAEQTPAAPVAEEEATSTAKVVVAKGITKSAKEDDDSATPKAAAKKPAAKAAKKPAAKKSTAKKSVAADKKTGDDDVTTV